MSTTKKILIGVGIVLVIASLVYWYWSVNKKPKAPTTNVAATSPLAKDTDAVTNSTDSGQSVLSNNAPVGEQ